MGAYDIHFDTAIKHIRIADHMLTQTYPLVKDDKLLLGVAENLHKALHAALKGVLEFERAYKRITAFHENYAMMVQIFEKKCAKNYNINKDILIHIKTLGEIIQAHAESPVEFSKKGQFIICSDEYKITKVTVEDLLAYIDTAKGFVTALRNRIDDYERLIR